MATKPPKMSKRADSHSLFFTEEPTVMSLSEPITCRTSTQSLRVFTAAQVSVAGAPGGLVGPILPVLGAPRAGAAAGAAAAGILDPTIALMQTQLQKQAEEHAAALAEFVSLADPSFVTADFQALGGTRAAAAVPERAMPVVMGQLAMVPKTPAKAELYRQREADIEAATRFRRKPLSSQFGFTVMLEFNDFLMKLVADSRADMSEHRVNTLWQEFQLLKSREGTDIYTPSLRVSPNPKATKMPHVEPTHKAAAPTEPAKFKGQCCWNFNKERGCATVDCTRPHVGGRSASAGNATTGTDKIIATGKKGESQGATLTVGSSASAARGWVFAAAFGCCPGFFSCIFGDGFLVQVNRGAG
ncbi:hypothetical protein CYMTET_32907 [Cymbomonas tetramitiformis]|uniref:Uncharacterized protein n=1 Tax=Cymbomonas tetramitiformis TaxID=36881 RepID=A0AAE0KRE1_9CHLO|nr:hypothetical protein CYMTET_32907 [Cymbomonas tetramitiformis]